MTTFISIFLSLIFLALSSIHFYWAMGGRWGSDSVFPSKDGEVTIKMPGVLPTLVVAFGLLGFGLIEFKSTGFIILNLPFGLDKYGLIIISSIFIVRAIGEFKYVGFFKKIKHTKFAQNDSKYYSPLCLLIGILTIILELSLLRKVF